MSHNYGKNVTFLACSYYLLNVNMIEWIPCFSENLMISWLPAFFTNMFSMAYACIQMRQCFFQDPFEMEPVRLRENSRENPNLIPTSNYYRMMGCVCELFYRFVKTILNLKCVGDMNIHYSHFDFSSYRCLCPSCTFQCTYRVGEWLCAPPSCLTVESDT